MENICIIIGESLGAVTQALGIFSIFLTSPRRQFSNQWDTEVSTATIWTERTLSRMGITTSDITQVDTEDGVESIALQPFPTSEHELAMNPTDHPQNTATRVQDGEDNRERSYDNGDTPSSPQFSTTKSMKLANILWLEMVSCLLVVAMIGALVGTIQPYQGQPQSRWPYSLPINTIVSFYSEVMRAAMVLVLGECLSQLKWSWFTSPRPLHHLEHYDSASRGPWGSLGLLWAVRLRALLPSLGGIMMILSLLLVPFTQQIVQFYSCTVPDMTVNASIPKTNFASAGYNGAIVSIDPSAQAVINSGVYDSIIKQVPFTCPTGNCTFDGVYHSMGWCSHCEDVSDQIEFRPSIDGTGSFTLPSTNLSATTGGSTFVMGASYNTIQAILGWNKNGTADPLSDTPWGKRGFGAAECSVNPCVRSYTSTVKGGTFTETIMSTYVGWDPNEYEENSIDVSCLNASEIQALHNAGCNFDPQKTAWVKCNGTDVAVVRPECDYQAVGPQVSNLFKYLSSMFNGELAYAPGAFYGPPILQTIFQGGNVTYSTIDDMFNRIAQGLTVWAREQGSNVTGQVYRGDTCVNARWGWLACPLSLMLGTVIFLVWTMDHTRRSEGSRQDYKSSPLALLFHRIGDVGSEGLISNIASSDELRKKAKTMRMVFQGTNDIWRFTEVEQLNTSGAKKLGA